MVSHIQKRHQSFKLNCKRAESREIKFGVDVGGGCIKTYPLIDKEDIFVSRQVIYIVFYKIPEAQVKLA